MARILKFVTLAIALAGGSSANAAGDAAKGKSVFQAQCSTCHTVVAGKASGIGPNLYGVVGRTAGTLPRYQFSTAMKSAGFNWSEAQLRAYLQAPGNVVRGNKMPFAGLGGSQKLNDLVAYLGTLK